MVMKTRTITKNGTTIDFFSHFPDYGRTVKLSYRWCCPTWFDGKKYIQERFFKGKICTL